MPHQVRHYMVEVPWMPHQVRHDIEEGECEVILP